MLTNLNIHNFAVVDHLELELTDQLSVLTGETGAGKSILIDALGLVLGDRADTGFIRHGANKAEINAIFDIENNTNAKIWLIENEIDTDSECIIRRTISKDGRSRAYINGQPLPVQSLRQLGEMLIDIHGQHEHQSLMKPGLQRQALDDFARHQGLLEKSASIYNDWQILDHELQSLDNLKQDREARP
jgi:DNA repair protein RecN (Recombination protein N)